jgi:hypothetical protein
MLVCSYDYFGRARVGTVVFCRRWVGGGEGHSTFEGGVARCLPPQSKVARGNVRNCLAWVRLSTRRTVSGEREWGWWYFAVGWLAGEGCSTFESGVARCLPPQSKVARGDVGSCLAWVCLFTRRTVSGEREWGWWFFAGGGLGGEGCCTFESGVARCLPPQSKVARGNVRNCLAWVCLFTRRAVSGEREWGWWFFAGGGLGGAKVIPRSKAGSRGACPRSPRSSGVMV